MSLSPSHGLKLVWYREQVFHTAAADYIFSLFDDPVDQSVRPAACLAPTTPLNTFKLTKIRFPPGSETHAYHCLNLPQQQFFSYYFIPTSFPFPLSAEGRIISHFLSFAQRKGASRGVGRVRMRSNRYSPEEFSALTHLVRRTGIATEDKNPPAPLRSHASRLPVIVQKRGIPNGQNGETWRPVHCSHLRRDPFSAASTRDQAVSSQWVDARSEAAERISQLGAQTLSQLRGGSDDQTRVCCLLFKHAHSEQKSEARVSSIHY